MVEVLIGEKFGRLTVLDELDERDSTGQILWRTKCECGNTVDVRRHSLISGNTKSCGCLQKDRVTTHGDTHTRLYDIWHGMKYRGNPNGKGKSVKSYRDKGIRVTKEWRDSYENFRDWAYANDYTDDKTIDRIDNNGDYKPSNCRWTDQETQRNNTDSNVNVEYEGKIQTLSQWSREKSMNKSTLSKRYARGLRGDELFEPIEDNTIYIEYKGKRQSLSEWVEETEFSYDLLKGRYYNGDRDDRLFRPVGADKLYIKYNDKTQTLGEWADEFGLVRSTVYDRYNRGDRDDHLFRPVRSDQ